MLYIPHIHMHTHRYTRIYLLIQWGACSRHLGCTSLCSIRHPRKCRRWDTDDCGIECRHCKWCCSCSNYSTMPKQALHGMQKSQLGHCSTTYRNNYKGQITSFHALLFEYSSMHTFCWNLSKNRFVECLLNMHARSQIVTGSSNCICISCDLRCGQASWLQSMYSLCSPMQVLPPSHVLCLLCLPPPQLAEHPLQTLHELHAGGTILHNTYKDNSSHLSYVCIYTHTCKQLRIMSLNSPTQLCSLQLWVSMADPSQSTPPTHARKRVRVPPLQVRLQELHVDHSDQLPETRNGKYNRLCIITLHIVLRRRRKRIQ